jgi:hypothetical protein
MGSGIQDTYTVERDAHVCYVMWTYLPMSHEAFYYEFRDGSDQLVATGVRAPAAGSTSEVTTITCIGGPPTTLSAQCLDALQQSDAGCTSGTCP